MSKKTGIRIGAAVAIAATALALVLVPRWRQPRPVVRIGLEGSPPFGKWTDGKPTGMLVELLELAAQRKSLRLAWTRTPAGGETSLRKGLIDVWPGMGHTPEREALFHITKPYLHNDFCLISKIGSGIHAVGDCWRRKVSYVNGPVTRRLAAKFLAEADRQPSTSRLDAVVAVCRGEAEAAFTEMRFVQEAMLSRPDGCQDLRFEVTQVRGAALEMGLATLPENAALGDKLRAGIEGLRADGTYAALLAFWNPLSLSENVTLLQEQQQRSRTRLFTAGLAMVGLIVLVLLWQNRRVSRARRAAEWANAALKTSMAQLREAHQRLRFHLACMPLACVVWDRELKVLEWNPAAERIFGWPEAEAVGKGVRELLFDAAARAEGEAAWARVPEAADTVCFAQENVARGGKRLLCEWSSVSLRDEDGSIAGVLSLGHDITERQRLAEELRQAQKLESIGRLAGGVAHEFNNLLTVVNGYGDLLLGQLSRQDPHRVPVQEIRQAGGRAATLTRQLLAFSRKQFLQPKPLDLNRAIAAHEETIRDLLGGDIELEIRPGSGVGRVMVDDEQFHQVLMNLLANAREALPKGGLVVLTTENAEVGEAGVLDRPEARPGPYVRLTVADNGVGMDRETEELIFEPFFTTRGRAIAAGLGLPMVYGVVRQSGGWIEVESDVGRGTAFHLYLPRLEDAGQPEAAGAPDAGAAASQTILVLDDQPGVRKLAATVFAPAATRCSKRGTVATRSRWWNAIPGRSTSCWPTW
jgi:PAS domain S-box-containing protein